MGLLVGVELDQLGLELRVEEDRLGGGDEVLHPLLEVVVGELVGVAVEDVDERLGRQQRELAEQGPSIAVAMTGVPPSSAVQRLARGVEVGGQRLVAARLLLQPRDRLLHGLQVGQDQLGLDRGEVGLRVDLAVDVGDVLVAEDAGDLADRGGLADVGEELVAQALALRRAADDAGDVDELDGRGQDPGRRRRARPAAGAARRGRRRRRRWARSWRTGSSPRARRSWSAR